MEVGYIDERISNLNCVMGHMSRGEACQDGDREEEEDKDQLGFLSSFAWVSWSYAALKISSRLTLPGLQSQKRTSQAFQQHDSSHLGTTTQTR